MKKKNEENQRGSDTKKVLTPPKFFYFIFCLGVLAVNVFAEAGQPSVAGIKVESVQPRRVYVSTSGQQNSATLRGKNLEKIYTIKVFLNDKAASKILGRLAKVHGETRGIFFVAAPNAEFSEGYKVYGITKDKQIFPIKMELEVVPPDDERGNPIPIEEMTKGKGDFAQKVISVDINQAPVVMKTIPDPFVIPADGQPQQVILKGRNLDKITEIRLRPVARKTYIGGSGKIPFEHDDKDVKLNLVGTKDTPSGSKYCLDLIMGKFIAGTLTFETVATPAQPLLKEPQSEAPATIESPSEKMDAKREEAMAEGVMP